MSAAKHTPAPWSVRFVKGSYKRPWFVEAGPKIVANGAGDQLEPTATSIGEATANAHLIAAAPEMLRALRACEEYMAFHATDCSEPVPLFRVRGVIAKAEGQS